MVPTTCPAKKISGGQQEEGHSVVHHVQGEHHQTYLLHHNKMPSSRIDKFSEGLPCKKGHGGTVPHYSLVNL